MKSFLTILFVSLAILAAPLSANAVVNGIPNTQFENWPITVAGDANGGKGFIPSQSTPDTPAECPVISVAEFMAHVGDVGKGIHDWNVVTGKAFENFKNDADFQAFLAKYAITFPEEISGMEYTGNTTKMDDGSDAYMVYFFTKDGCTGYYSGYINKEAIDKGLDHPVETAPKG